MPSPTYTDQHRMKAAKAIHQVGGKKIALLNETINMVNAARPPSLQDQIPSLIHSVDNSAKSNIEYIRAHDRLNDITLTNEIHHRYAKATQHDAQLRSVNKEPNTSFSNHLSDLAKVASWTGTRGSSYAPHATLAKPEYAGELLYKEREAAVKTLTDQLDEVKTIMDRNPLPAKSNLLRCIYASSCFKSGDSSHSPVLED